MNDIIIKSDYITEINSFKKRIKEEFETKELRELKYFLEMKVARISQRKYILDLLKETDKIGCKPMTTPLPQNWISCAPVHDVWVDKGQCQRLVGRQLFIYN